MAAVRKITDLPDLISDLSPEDRAIADRIFDVSSTTGRLDPPEAMYAWIEKSFGSVDNVTAQRIVKVTNRITLEGTLFNELRASRPLDTGVSLNLDREIAATKGDPFCHPKEGTPADVFGRVEGDHATTASNVAKYDGFHGVIVFDDHNPLHLTPEKVAGYVSVGLEWGRKALEADPEARYPFLMWNCLWRAGGSIIHGHAQVTATRGSHYPKIERLRRAASAYKREHGSDYFEDLHSIHASLGLDVPLEGIRAFASLSPIKEKELVVIGERARRRIPEPRGRRPAARLRRSPRRPGLQRSLLHAPARSHAGGLVRLPNGRLHRGPGRPVQPHLGHGGDGALRSLRRRLRSLPGRRSAARARFRLRPGGHAAGGW